MTPKSEYFTLLARSHPPPPHHHTTIFFFFFFFSFLSLSALLFRNLHLHLRRTLSLSLSKIETYRISKSEFRISISEYRKTLWSLSRSLILSRYRSVSEAAFVPVSRFLSHFVTIDFFLYLFIIGIYQKVLRKERKIHLYIKLRNNKYGFVFLIPPFYVF